jgi:hypothetical protein
MAILFLVIAWALAEAIVAVALVANPGSRTDRPGILSGLLDWRV